MNEKILPFPEGFIWGAATSSFQTEGETVPTDWSYWQGLPGRIKDGTTAKKAVEGYLRYEEDFRMIASMGHNGYRFSVEWARIEPEEGVFDDEVLEHYGRMLLSLRAKNIEPVLTLNHFTLPLWFFKKGGWENPNSVDLFTRFVQKVASRYADQVRYWITLNEPAVYIFQSYLVGVWPSPEGATSLSKGLGAFRNMVLAHRAAYFTLHQICKESRVGVAHHMKRFLPFDENSFEDRMIVQTQEYLLNDLFLEILFQERILFPVGGGEPFSEKGDTLDFIGLNYYTGQKSKFDLQDIPTVFSRPYPIQKEPEYSDLGWEIYPEGLFYFLDLLSRRYKKPIMITENGIADKEDLKRPAYILRHLGEVFRAIQGGAEVLGYLHWSLMDNFEWAEGLTPRFGLVEVDYTTQERLPRKSAYLLQEICKRNAITQETVESYAPAIARNYFENFSGPH